MHQRAAIVTVQLLTHGHHLYHLART
jgi:hypothetical protein